MLVRLLYASRATDPACSAVDEILAHCRQFNPISGITGILCYGGGIFLQAIEGGRMAVSDLYGHIQKDIRHKDVVLLHYEEISERLNLGKKTIRNYVSALYEKIEVKDRFGAIRVSIEAQIHTLVM